MNYPKQLENN